MKHNKFLHVIIILVFALLLGFYSLPGTTQKSLLPFLPDNFVQNKINLGLDLQGGSQLDYKIDLSKVPEKDRSSIINGIISVIQKRVNSLGVSEPHIYSSTVGEEHHIIVELAGIKDLNKAKATVGKTIQLEFKTARTAPDPNHAKKIQATAQKALETFKAGKEDFQVFGAEQEESNSDTVKYTKSTKWQFGDQINTNILKQLQTLKTGEISPNVFQIDKEVTLGTNGSLVQQKGYNIIQLIAKQKVDRTIKVQRSVKTADILIAYKGAVKAEASVTRTQDEAKKLAASIQAKATANPANFDKLVKQYSNDTATKNKAGINSTPVTANSKVYVKEYTDAAMALQKANDISAVIPTTFGYQIIKAIEITKANTHTEKQEQYKYARLFYNSADSHWVKTGLNGQFFQRADVTFDKYVNPQVSITFNAEGAKKFETLTGKNIGKQIAIFVGGNLISAPVVNQKISGGKAVIQGRFTIKEAENLARDLNTGAIPAPIVLVGQYTIGASLGAQALNNSIFAGLIGFFLVILFMIGYYRFAGLIAAIALTIYTIIMFFLIKSTIPFQYSLPISIAIFIYLIMRILNNKESGPEKLLTLILSCFILFFLSFILSTPIVLTLAGIAGIVLSIGMAVDANILIFERVKEEIRDGRELNSAIQVGFDRAWSSIKDSNFSSLITCGILFYFGSSIIQGFAFNLGAGILISMFTAITITRVLLAAACHTRLGHYLGFFGFPKRKDAKPLQVIGRRKLFYSISITFILLSILGLFVFGLRPGMDFTGGSLMEIKFDNPPTFNQITKALADSQKNINNAATAAIPTTGTTPPSAKGTVPTTNYTIGTNGKITQTSSPSTTNNTTSPSTTVSPTPESKLDLGTPEIYNSNDAIIIKTKSMSADQHDQIIRNLKAKFGNLTENRFESIGPTVGASLRYKALFAVLLASLMIVFYVAFAFRKVPRSVGKWRFGVSTIIALAHDLIIMVGIYITLGYILNLEVDALFITALLTTMGFSVHDSIVVLDRLREKLKAPPKDMTLEDMTNLSVNETMSRSINTSFTVALALLALVIWGPDTIRAFNIAILIGIIVGTYSSIFIASFVLVDWYNWAMLKKTAKEKN